MNGKVSVSSVAWFASETKGSWNSGTLIGYNRGAINEGQVVGLSCPSNSYCEAVGQYGIKNSSMTTIGETHSLAASYMP
jgi:hypothetical protein